MLKYNLSVNNTGANVLNFNDCCLLTKGNMVLFVPEPETTHTTYQVYGGISIHVRVPTSIKALRSLRTTAPLVPKSHQ